MKKILLSSLFAVLLTGFCTFSVKAQDKKVYSSVEMQNPPTYPGGIAKLYEFLSKNISYPKMAAEAKQEGTVYLSFMIEKDGSLSELQSHGRKLGYGLEEEAIRVLSMSPPWNPGTHNGEPVIAKYNIPVKFSLKKK